MWITIQKKTPDANKFIKYEKKNIKEVFKKNSVYINIYLQSKHLASSIVKLGIQEK